MTNNNKQEGVSELYNNMLLKIIEFYESLCKASLTEEKGAIEATYWKQKFEKIFHICQQQPESGQ